MRPDLRVEPAFLELSKPSFATVVDRLVKAGYDEIVVVPLLLTEAYHAKVDVPAAVAEATARHEGPAHPRHPRPRAGAGVPGGARPAAARRPQRRPGPRARRAGARRGRLLRPAREPGGRPGWRGCGAPSTGCRRWRRTPRPLPPATGEAVRQFRAEGRRHIAVGSLFLAPGLLPDRAAELALEAGAVAVSEPLGADPEVARTILARYAVGAVELVPV